MYRAMHPMHACIEFKLKMPDRKESFPCFFGNLNWSVKLSSLRPQSPWKELCLSVKNSLNLNLKHNRSRRKSFAVQKKNNNKML